MRRSVYIPRPDLPLQVAMLGLRCRTGRQLRRQLTVLRRQLASGADHENESPSQRERRYGRGCRTVDTKKSNRTVDSLRGQSSNQDTGGTAAVSFILVDSRVRHLEIGAVRKMHAIRGRMDSLPATCAVFFFFA